MQSTSVAEPQVLCTAATALPSGATARSGFWLPNGRLSCAPQVLLPGGLVNVEPTPSSSGITVALPSPPASSAPTAGQQVTLPIVAGRLQPAPAGRLAQRSA
jgi:hypothetical protein